jgi:DNA polymerase-3 subunit delta'
MSFRQFPEQRQAVELLQRSLDRGRLGHGYLFSGSSLDELTAVARTLAKTLNCVTPPRRGASGTPLDCCDQCPSCRKIDAENHADVHWVRPESKLRVITIDSMRELMQTIHLKPTEAAYKVAVIAAADRLNVQAANAFLKTLEEPPSRCVIVLLSTDPQRLLETILSRCLRLHFPGEPDLGESANAAWVGGFCEVALKRQNGLLGRYLLLGTLLNRLAEIKSQTEEQVTARSPLEKHDDIDPKLREKWEDELAASIEAEYRRRRSELLLTLQWWLRDVWLHTLAVGRELLAFPKLAEGSQAVAAGISAEDAGENLRIVEQLQRLLATNVQEALALEVSLLKLKL